MHKRHDVAHAPGLAVTTAILAVLAAVGSLVSNKTSSAALAAKNQAILIRADASDAYNSYESHEIREHVYEAESLAKGSSDADARRRLDAIATSEKALAEPYLQKAHELDERSQTTSERSEALANAHEYYDTALALVEIAIAIVSISALASSWYLVGLAGLSAFAGLVVFVIGLRASP